MHRHTSGSTEQPKERAVPSLAPAHPQVYTKSTNMNMNKTGGLIMPYLPANQAQCLLARADEVFCQLVQVYGPFSHQLSDPSPFQCQAHSLLTQLTSYSSCAVHRHTHTNGPLWQLTHLSRHCPLELWAPSSCGVSMHESAP